MILYRSPVLHTLSGSRNLCGHFSDLAPLELALDALLFDSCCAVWKDSSRLSYVKYWSARCAGMVILSSLIDILLDSLSQYSAIQLRLWSYWWYSKTRLDDRAGLVVVYLLFATRKCDIVVVRFPWSFEVEATNTQVNWRQNGGGEEAQELCISCDLRFVYIAIRQISKGVL